MIDALRPVPGKVAERNLKRSGGVCSVLQSMDLGPQSAQLFTLTFEQSNANQRPEPEGRAIAALKIVDWREIARKRRARAKMYIPPSAHAEVGTVGSSETINSGPSLVGLHKRRRTQVDTTQDVPTETEPPLATEDFATETETDVRYVHLLLTRKVATALKVPRRIIFPRLTLRVVHPPRTMRSGKIKKTFLTRRPCRITSGCPSHSLVRHCSAGWAGSPPSRRAVTRIGA
jgi:hypothetical protein